MIQAQQRNCIKSIHSVPIGLRSGRWLGSSVWKPLSCCVTTLLQSFSWPTNIIRKIFSIHLGTRPPLNKCKPAGSRDSQAGPNHDVFPPLYNILGLYSQCWVCVFVVSWVHKTVVCSFAYVILQHCSLQEAAASLEVFCYRVLASSSETFSSLWVVSFPHWWVRAASGVILSGRPLLVTAATVPKCLVNCFEIAL